MTDEQKQLLFIDLCGRLPYGVIVHSLGIPHEQKLIGYIPNIDYYKIKPYLRPMSSMTEEEEIVFLNKENYEIYDWLNAHHFDYRGLIPMGLAIEAPVGMYKEK